MSVLMLCLCLSAWAWEPPARPDAPKPSSTDAPRSAELYAGHQLPPWLVTGSCTAAVDFGVLPIWRWQDYRLLEQSHLPHVVQAARMETARLQLANDWQARRIEDLEAEMTDLRMPPPWWKRPGVYRWEGRAEVLLTLLAAGAALHWAGSL